MKFTSPKYYTYGPWTQSKVKHTFIYLENESLAKDVQSTPAPTVPRALWSFLLVTCKRM